VREAHPVEVAADRDVCIGSGNCVFTAPEVFDQDDDGFVVVLTADVDPGQDGAARQAVAHCPSGALRLVEE
jgi:ferredoxin